jgi:hypothetical protein
MLRMSPLDALAIFDRHPVGETIELLNHVVPNRPVL